MATRTELLAKAKANNRERTFKFVSTARSKKDVHFLLHYFLEHDIPFSLPNNAYFDRIGFDLKAHFGVEDLEISILQDVLKIEPWNTDGTYDAKQLAYTRWLYHKEFAEVIAVQTLKALRSWLNRPTATIKIRKRRIKPGVGLKATAKGRLENMDWLNVNKKLDNQ